MFLLGQERGFRVLRGADSTYNRQFVETVTADTRTCLIECPKTRPRALFEERCADIVRPGGLTNG